MTGTTNSTLKGVIMFGALTIAAAVFFVGSEDNSGTLANVAETSEEAAPVRSVRETVDDDEYAEEDLDWGEESLYDDTEGFDPTPSDGDNSNDARPMDNAINATDPEGRRVEVRDRPIASGDRVGIPSTAKLPE